MNGTGVDVALASRWVGYGVLILTLPSALFAATLFPNEYTAMGSGGIDCDGPEQVFIFAYPALTLYGSAAAINIFRARKRRNLIVAGLCILVCAAITPNFVAALSEQRDNDTHHRCE